MTEMGIATSRRPGRPRTAQRAALVALLKATEVGAIVTYTKMGEATGMPDIRGCVHLLYDARSECQRQRSMFFMTVKDVGIRRVE